MEFDNNISLKEISTFELESLKTEDIFWQEVWDDLRAHFKNVGHAGNGEFWIDYSTAMRTQYIVCKINRHGEKIDGVPDDGKFHVRLYCGTKAGRVTDVLMLLVLLGAFWFLSKSVVPSPSAFTIIMIVFCLLVAASMVYMLHVPFGKKESASLEKMIRKHQ